MSTTTAELIFFAHTMTSTTTELLDEGVLLTEGLPKGVELVA